MPSRDYVLHPLEGGQPLRIDYERELNPQQCEAATAPPGPSLVLAGAGSGKTRTLVYRVAYLLERGVQPDRILLLTFTNKAAREMMRRVSDLLGVEMSSLWGGTFHSIGARILRIHAEELGYRGDFTILDRDDSEALLKICLGVVAEATDSKRLLPKPEVVGNILSHAINERVALADFIARRHPEWESETDAIQEVARLYTERKRVSNAMDFDDLLALWLRLLERNEEVRERYQRRFQWVLVDEYQDTNRIQSDLIDLIVAQHRNLMAVGDDSQSIYSWRGADFRNIIEFPRRYPDARVFKIEINYRSTPEILEVANAVIARNQRQFSKVLTAARRSGMRPALVGCEDGHQQAAFVARRVIELHEEGVPLTEIAVLYRSHFHALELQFALTQAGIPFVITSGARFFEQAHLKDVAAWLKLIANPADELSFKRIVLLLPGIGPRAAEKLWKAFREEFRKPDPAGGRTPVARALMAVQATVPRKSVVSWAELATTMAQVEAAADRDPGVLIRIVTEGFYEEYARKEFANAASRIEDLEQLAVYAGQFASTTDFLTQLALLSNLETEADQRPAGEEERIRLSTVHQAKGLEFRVVFVIMLGEGLFPSARSLDDPDREEEERRLFYVAVTRAKDELYLSYPLLRATHGAGMTMFHKSRFLSEIPEELLDTWNLRPAGSYGFLPLSASTTAAGHESEFDEPF